MRRTRILTALLIVIATGIGLAPAPAEAAAAPSLVWGETLNIGWDRSSSPTIADITGDGVPEVMAVGFDQHLHAWRLDGSYVPGFPVYTYDTAVATPALADIDGDGIGDDCDPNPALRGGGRVCSTGGGAPVSGLVMAGILGLALVRRRSAVVGGAR